MTTRTTTPPSRAVLGWMQAHPDRLRALLNEEAGPVEEAGPADDAAIRAHLRFVAEALAGTARGDRRGRLAGLAERLRTDPAGSDELDTALELVGGATAHELRLQFGASVADDPSMRETVERRVRIGAWHRVFLRALEDALGPDGLDGDQTLAWMADHQVLLADTIFAMDRRAKQMELARGGPDAIADVKVVNRIGQAAVVQAHTRFLVDALEATLQPEEAAVRR